MSIQDRNAGNTGDQLKHALLVEILTRIGETPTARDWSYAETHAGAGRFMTSQAERLGISAMAVTGGRSASLARDMCDLPPGYSYAELLADWSCFEGATGVYPGSPVIASVSGRYLNSRVFVEFDEKVFGRLCESIAFIDGVVADSLAPGTGNVATMLRGSFEDYLETLLEPERLLLLVDPFYYEHAAPDGIGGRVGMPHLSEICRRLAEKNAILLFFSSSLPRHCRLPGDEGENQARNGTWRILDRDFSALAPPALRCFRVGGAPHAVHLAGWGTEGIDLVQNLPGQENWQRSWLAQKPLSLEILETQRI